MDSTTRLRNIKVGIAAIVSVLMLLGFYYLVGSLRMSGKAYPLQVLFTEVRGIEQGTAVMMAGIKVGTVRGVSLTPANKAMVEVLIQQGTDIPEGSQFRIASVSLLGDRYIEIVPGPSQNPKVRPEQTLVGTEAFNLDDFFTRVEMILVRVDRLGELAEGWLGDPTIKQGTQQMVKNLEAASAGAVTLVAEMNSIVSENRATVSQSAANVTAATRNIADATESLSGAFAQIETLTASTSPEDIQSVMANIRAATEQLNSAIATMDRVAANFETFSSDPELQGDIKASAHNIRLTTESAREAVESAKAVVDRVGEIVGVGRVPSAPVEYRPLPGGRGPKGQMLYNFDSERTRADVNYDFQYSADSFLRAGVFDAGETNKINLQAGKVTNNLAAYRFGLYQSRLGLGYDFLAPGGWLIESDIYRPSRLRLDVKGSREITPEARGVFGFENLLGGPQAVLGVQLKF